MVLPGATRMLCIITEFAISTPLCIPIMECSRTIAGQHRYWEGPSGNRVLMWNGDHYHLGNEMFFSPHSGSAYTIRDELYDHVNSKLFYDVEDEEAAEEAALHTRIERYLHNLEDEKYPYSMVPFMVSGAITDNAPPSKDIARRVNKLNEYYKGKIHFQMATLGSFSRK